MREPDDAGRRPRPNERRPPAAHAQTLRGWGRVGAQPAEVLGGEDLAPLAGGAVLSRGLGRSYGDAAQPAEPGGSVLVTGRADRVLAFDRASGRLRAEAGLSLRALNRLTRRQGWFTPVSPGTEFVTLGGMVAADVHGKNHHRAGTLGAHVSGLRIRVPDGRIVDCSPDESPELFDATLGGMGLVGHVLEVELRLEAIPSPWIREHAERTSSLEDMLVRLRARSARHPFTVGWIDMFARGRLENRGLLLSGEWAQAGEAPPQDPPELLSPSLPFDVPAFCSTWPFGRIGYAGLLLTKRERTRIAHPGPFFYILDRVGQWNRFYGKRGFIQYQCVLPSGDDPQAELRASTELFRRLRAHQADVFLCVVKDFGAEGRGLISFPRSGFTFALDMPYRGESTRRMVDDLNEHVLACGGRIYLAKDELTRPEHFRAMEPRLERFLEVKRKWDPRGLIESQLSRRLFGPLG